MSVWGRVDIKKLWTNKFLLPFLLLKPKILNFIFLRVVQQAKMGDAEYVAAFQQVVMPVAYEVSCWKWTIVAFTVLKLVNVEYN